MSFNWFHVPVAIRFVSEHNLHSVSGIHLILRDKANYVTDFILTVNYIPSVKEYLIIVNSTITDHERVEWFPAKYECEYEITDVTLLNQISHFTSNGFRFIPHDQVGRRVAILKLLMLNEGVKRDFINANHYKPIYFMNPGGNGDIGKPISISSFPFNFTNSLLFSNFLSNGTINYNINLNDRQLAYLTDTKYLENMCGGVVYFENTLESIGLVLGNLRKVNGDGELTIILSWTLIWEMINTHGPMNGRFNLNKLQATQILKNKSSQVTSHVSSVLPIVTIDKYNNTTWGSCIYYKEDTIITNNHVVKPFLKESNVRCYIYYKPEMSIQIISQQDIKTPFLEFDLSFITLSSEQIRSVKESHKPITFSNSLKIGQNVTSQGFGLFFNPKIIRPIVSKGIINASLSIPTSLSSDTGVDSVIVTSSSCWNGSSGGGLFNSKQQFMGMICSNGQVKVTSATGQPESEVSEKLTRLVFVLPLQTINFCFDYIMNPLKVTINPKIQELWNMRSFHQDVVIESSKL